MPYITSVFLHILNIHTMNNSIYWMCMCVSNTFRLSWKFIRLPLQFNHICSWGKFYQLCWNSELVRLLYIS